jgi:hypothetical protein
LGDKPIGCWNTEETSDPCGESKEKKIPVEAGWLAEWKLRALGNER